MLLSNTKKKVLYYEDRIRTWNLYKSNSQELKEQYHSFKRDLDNDVHVGLFSLDKQEDKKQMKEFLNAFEKVHSYYSIYGIDEYPHES